MKNPSFYKAYTQHKAFFEAIKQSIADVFNDKSDIIQMAKSLNDYIPNLHKYLDYYKEAYDESNKYESAADYIALIHFIAAIKCVFSGILFSTAQFDSAKKLITSVSVKKEVDEVLQMISGLPEKEYYGALADSIPVLSEKH